LAGKVTAGLAESNGSLPSGDNLKSQLQAECLYTEISSRENFILLLVSNRERLLISMVLTT